ncbi:MAG: TonB-dependent receptor [Marinilabiliales bacterium]
MKLLYFIFIFFIINNVYCQNFNYQINGRVNDSLSNTPIEFANIALYNEDSVFQVGTITDNNGKFSITLSNKGKYKLIVSFIGYKSTILNINVINRKNNIGIIKIKPSTILLKNVEVYGKQAYVNLIDKEIVRPDSSILKTSTNALEVMSKISGLKVNRLNNTVSILGRDNVLVLLNGVHKEGGINLSSIKPDDIEEIEIIKNPSSKYDSEYSSIINIILKKRIKNGVSVNLDLNYFGLRHNESSLNLEFGKKNIRLFCNYQLYLRNHQREITTHLESETDTNNFIINTFKKIEHPFELGHFYQYGIDYFISKKSILNFTGDYKIINTNYDGIKETNSIINNIEKYNLTTNQKINGNYVMQNYSLFYKLKFDSIKSSLSFNTNYYKMNFEVLNLYNDIYYYSDTIFSNREQNDYDNKESINANIDYQQTLNKKIQIESGYQLYLRDIQNVYNQNSIIDKSSYTEVRNSIYCNFYISNITKFNFLLGVRFENSVILLDNNINKYSNLNPNVGVLYKLNPKSSITYNFKRSINRPNFQQLKPFEYQIDSLNYTKGNPYLIPEKNDYNNISYVYRNKTFIINPSLFYKTGYDVIANTVIVNNGIRYSSQENIARTNEYGFQLSSSFKPFDFITLNTYFDIYNQTFINDSLINKIFSLSFSLSSEIQLPKDLFAGFDITIPGKRLHLQGYYLTNPSIDAVYLGKLVLKSNGMLLIGISNPINDMKVDYYEKSNNYKYTITDITIFRMFVIKITYYYHKGNNISKVQHMLNMEKDK